MTITVYGIPGPQGSKRFIGQSKSGRGILIESSAKVRPWREAVKYAAITQMDKGVTGPVMVHLIFTLPRPKSAPKKKRTWPDRRPDLDKLCRSTLDALVSVGAIDDDSRVVYLHAEKTYPGDMQGSLHVPGCTITIEAMT
jgi:Holliday junction resolvase RusA-like endonuclease